MREELRESTIPGLFTSEPETPPLRVVLDQMRLTNGPLSVEFRLLARLLNRVEALESEVRALRAEIQHQNSLV